jgi:hypothetical protein
MKDLQIQGMDRIQKTAQIRGTAYQVHEITVLARYAVYITYKKELCRLFSSTRECHFSISSYPRVLVVKMTSDLFGTVQE